MLSIFSINRINYTQKALLIGKFIEYAISYDYILIYFVKYDSFYGIVLYLEHYHTQIFFDKAS